MVCRDWPQQFCSRFPQKFMNFVCRWAVSCSPVKVKKNDAECSVRLVEHRRKNVLRQHHILGWLWTENSIQGGDRMIYLFLAQGFEEVEAITPLDLLRRAGAQVKTVGVGGNRITGSHGIEVTADLEEGQINLQDMEMIILPGGMPGTKNLEKSPIVRESINYCAQHEKKIAAICAAPSILGKMNLLDGHCAVCYPGYESVLKGAEIKTDPVCVSGNIITARGAGVALLFGLKLVEVLFGKQKSEEMKEQVQCE